MATLISPALLSRHQIHALQGIEALLIIKVNANMVTKNGITCRSTRVRFGHIMATPSALLIAGLVSVLRANVNGRSLSY